MQQITGSFRQTGILLPPWLYHRRLWRSLRVVWGKIRRKWLYYLYLIFSFNICSIKCTQGSSANTGQLRFVHEISWLRGKSWRPSANTSFKPPSNTVWGTISSILSARALKFQLTPSHTATTTRQSGAASSTFLHVQLFMKNLVNLKLRDRHE